jgi:hypothetical protein
MYANESVYRWDRAIVCWTCLEITAAILKYLRGVQANASFGFLLRFEISLRRPGHGFTEPMYPGLHLSYVDSRALQILSGTVCTRVGT